MYEKSNDKKKSAFKLFPRLSRLYIIYFYYYYYDIIIIIYYFRKKKKIKYKRCRKCRLPPQVSINKKIYKKFWGELTLPTSFTLHHTPPTPLIYFIKDATYAPQPPSRFHAITPSRHHGITAHTYIHTYIPTYIPSIHTYIHGITPSRHHAINLLSLP